MAVTPHGRADVYCLDVPGEFNFAIEGGLVVHNCYDETRYACQSRPYVRDAPKPVVLDPFADFRKQPAKDILAQHFRNVQKQKGAR